MIFSAAVRIELPYPPSLNRYLRHVRGRTVLSAEAKSYRQQAAWLARQEGFRAPIAGQVVVRAVLRPKKPLRAGKGLPRCIDIDNGLKVALDALNGVVWVDDSQLVDLRITRGEPVPGGALDVTVYEAVGSADAD